MKTRSVLVRFPGYPLSLESLVPDSHLALWAGCLLDAGHQSRILDCGTVESLQRQVPPEGRESMRRMADLLTDDAPMPTLGALFTFWQLTRLDRAYRAHQEEYAKEVAQNLALRKSLNFVLFRLVDDDDAAVATIIAARLRALKPEVRILAAGPFIDSFAESYLTMASCFDACLLGDIERSLVRFAEKINLSEEWEDIPNLVYRRGVHLVRTDRRVETDLDNSPAPAYEPDIYPALAGTGKLRLFTVEDSRGLPSVGNAVPVQNEPLRLKTPARVVDEIWRLAAQYGARAFHLAGMGTPALHAVEVGRELLARNQHILYTRVSRPDLCKPVAFKALRSSGCHALEVRVDSGSQRLLDTFYGHNYTVSQVEAVIAASKAAGIFTSTRFTYPTPADDHHTESETLRMIARTRPHAVGFDLPDIRPGSAWYEYPAEYGFMLNKKTYLADRLKCRRRFPLPPHRWPASPLRMGQIQAAEVVRRQEQIALATSQYSALLFFTGIMALWAQFVGYAGREAEFQVLSRHALLGEGLDGVSDWVTGFNARASASTPAIGFRPPVSLKAAVGN